MLMDGTLLYKPCGVPDNQKPTFFQMDFDENLSTIIQPEVSTTASEEGSAIDTNESQESETEVKDSEAL